MVGRWTVLCSESAVFMMQGYSVSEVGRGAEAGLNRIIGNIRILVDGAQSFLGELEFCWAVMTACLWFIIINV